MTPPAHRLVPTATAALALGISPAAIRQLAHRGKLTRYGTKQRALYDVNELATLPHVTAVVDDHPATCHASARSGVCPPTEPSP